jgi:hypothetical protein
MEEHQVHPIYGRCRQKDCIRVRQIQRIVQTIRGYEGCANGNTHNKQAQAVQKVSTLESIFIKYIRIRGDKFHVNPRATKRKPNAVPRHLQEGHITVFDGFKRLRIVFKYPLRRQTKSVVVVFVNRFETRAKTPYYGIDKHECVNGKEKEHEYE